MIYTYTSLEPRDDFPNEINEIFKDMIKKNCFFRRIGSGEFEEHAEIHCNFRLDTKENVQDFTEDEKCNENLKVRV